MNYEKTIFSFWEPRGSMIPYLELCRRTWQRNLPDYEIIFLDYSNLDSYLPEGTYDMTILRKLTAMMQKDAVMVAVLKAHGGIFMDADTLVTGDIAPLVGMLTDTDVVMFSTHCGFMAAKPGSHLLTLWYNNIQGKLNFLSEVRDKTPQLPWDFFANSAMADVMDKMIKNPGSFHMMQKHVEDKFVLAHLKTTRDQKLLASRMKLLINRIGNALMRRKRALYFLTVFRHYLAMLDRLEYGFIPEAIYFTTRRMTPEEKYWKFWFDNSIDVKNVFRPNQMVIGLHNSWTHQWYKDLPEKDVLENEALLSRTLKHLLT